MKLNRKWIMVLALVMSMAMATTGTLAYLTDRDSEANVFTMGNVEIDLNEEFSQGAELVPGTEVDKVVSIKNTGKTDAWVWYTITYPKALDLTESGKAILWTGFTTENHDNQGYEGYNDGEDEWLIEYTGAPYLRDFIDENGVEMVEFTVLYQKPLAVGEETPTSLEKLWLDKTIDIDPDGNLARVEKGIAEAIDWNINEDGNPIVYVSAYAIQTEGFATVQDGYKAYNAQWTTEEGVNNGLEYGTPSTIETAEELLTALENGAEGELVYTGSEDVVIGKSITLTNDTTIRLTSAELNFDADGKLVVNGADVAILDTKIANDDSSNIFEVANGTLTLGEGTTLENASGMDTSGLFNVYGGKVVLDGAAISNNNNNETGFLFVVSGDAEVVIEDGTEITGNTFTGGDSGNNNCLFDISGGTLIMNGGKISGNNYGFRTLINVEARGNFVMNGGEISGNNYTGTKGGYVVFLTSGANFEMNGGKIAAHNASYAVCKSGMSGTVSIGDGATIEGAVLQ